MPKKLRVVYVESGRKAEIREIDGSLEGLQKAVGGFIEAIYPYDEPVALVCNEEGKLGGYIPNRALYDGDGDVYDIVFGNFFICGAPPTSDEFESLTDEQCAKFLKMYETPETAIICPDGRILIVKLR